MITFTATSLNGSQQMGGYLTWIMPTRLCLLSPSAYPIPPSVPSWASLIPQVHLWSVSGRNRGLRSEAAIPVSQRTTAQEVNPSHSDSTKLSRLREDTFQNQETRTIETLSSKVLWGWLGITGTYILIWEIWPKAKPNLLQFAKSAWVLSLSAFPVPCLSNSEQLPKRNWLHFPSA